MVIRSYNNPVFHFIGNVSTKGTTIYSNKSIILIDNIAMVRNLAAKGGGVEIVNSEMIARDSKFIRNSALQGGVVFAI